MTMRSTASDWETRERVPDEFEAALKGGKKSVWYDDALYYFAEWMANNGRSDRRRRASGNKNPTMSKPSNSIAA